VGKLAGVTGAALPVKNLFIESSVKNGRALFFESIFAEYAATADSSRVDPLHNELTLMAAPFPA